MIARRSIAAPFLNARLNVDKYLAVRGLILSHAIGACLLITFLFDRVIRMDLPFTRPIDVPFYIVGLWLILDRRGRLGTVRISFIDYLYLGFVAFQAFSFVYADLMMVRFMGFRNYLDLSALELKPYLYFVLVREAMNRRGFSPKIMIYWLLAALSASALMGILQSRDLLGVRSWSYNFYHQYLDEVRMHGPSKPWQAKGATPHANTMAHTMWLGLAVIVGLGWGRKLKPWEIAAGVVMMAALVATYSRSGVIAIAGMAVALVLFQFIRKHYRAAFLTLFATSALAVLGIAGVYAFNVERLKPIIEGEGSVSSPEKLGSFRIRVRKAFEAIRLGMKSPIFGVAPVGSLINNQNAVTFNNYAFEGKLDNSYTLSWVNYGMAGVALLLGFLWALFRTVVIRWGRSPFAVTAFLMGAGYAIHFNTENLLFITTMAVPMAILALVMGGWGPDGPVDREMPGTAGRNPWLKFRPTAMSEVKATATLADKPAV